MQKCDKNLSLRHESYLYFYDVTIKNTQSSYCSIDSYCTGSSKLVLFAFILLVFSIVVQRFFVCVESLSRNYHLPISNPPGEMNTHTTTVNLTNGRYITNQKAYNQSLFRSSKTTEIYRKKEVLKKRSSIQLKNIYTGWNSRNYNSSIHTSLPHFRIHLSAFYHRLSAVLRFSCLVSNKVLAKNDDEMI